VRKPLIRSLVALSLASCIFNVTNAADAVSNRKQLDSLLHAHWEEQMKQSPEWASMLGDKRYNDKLSDFSQAQIDKDLRDTHLWMKKFQALDVAGLSEQERLTRELMIRNLQLNLDGAKLKNWEIPLLHNFGIHIDAPQMVSSLSFTSVKDYEDYLARLNQLPRLFEQTMVQMKKGMQDNIMPPKFLAEKVVQQCEDIAKLPVDKSPFAQPLEKMPASFSPAQKKHFNEQIKLAIRSKIAPAYKKMAQFVQKDYAPKGRTEVGLWALPDGAARYAFQAQNATTTLMTPEEIHQIGLTEVARIEAEMAKVASKLGFADVASFNAAILKNPELHLSLIHI
jgi:uncharacterized protein (DUF885 family)